MKNTKLKSALIALAALVAISQSAQAGLLKRFFYDNINGQGVTNLFGTNTSGVVVFPGSPGPTPVESIPADSTYGPFYAEALEYGDAHNNFGSWIPGYVEPPQTGYYVFYIYGDDETHLLLNSDPADPKNPAKKQLVAQVTDPNVPHTGWANRRQWNKYAGQESAPIYLEQGKFYYMEVLHKEGTGGDRIGIGWRTPDGKIQQPMSSFYFQPTPDPSDVPVSGPFTGLVNPNIDQWTGSEDWYTIYDGNQVVMYVDLRNVDIQNQPVSVTWFKNNVQIPGATQTYYAFRAASADGGAIFRATVKVGAATLQSSPMTLTVYPDSTPPMVTSAGLAPQNPTEIRVVFNEDVTEASAETLSNYSLPGGNIQSATLLGDNRTVVLKTALLQPIQVYTLSVSGVRDMSSAGNTMAPSQHSFTITDGQVLLRIYFETGVTSLATLRTFTTGNANYLNGNAAEIRYVSSSSYGWNIYDNYQAQWVGYITPPESGPYVFALASDDHSVLFLSTDDQAANKREILSVNGSNGRWQINEYASQVLTTPINLEAGKRYYIEGVWRDGTGGDGISIFWQKPSDAPIPVVNSQAQVEPYLIPASAMSLYKGFGNVAITNQPASFASMEGDLKSFTVGPAGVDGTMPYFYQWYRGGAPIPGAQNYVYNFRPRLADNGVDYYLVVSNYFSSATSAVVNVTVSQDVVKPALAAAGSLNRQEVRVRFSEPVDPVSATALANYSLKSSAGAAVAISAAAMATNDAAIVFLTTAALVDYGTYDLSVQGVQDIADAPNTVDPATAVFTAYNMDKVERINNTQSWGAYAEGDRIYIQAGGADIWGGTDQMVFAYKNLTGNFDLKARGVSLFRADAWSKAGIMVRESNAANSRNCANLITPTDGQNVRTAQIRDTTGAGASVSSNDAGNQLNSNLQPGMAARPAMDAYSNAWVRLQRIGNAIYYYHSTDGINWKFWTFYDSSASTGGPLPSTLLVGIAVTSHTTSATTDSVFAEYGPIDQGPLALATSPVSQTVRENTPATFAVTASGRQPYGYEWLKNGQPIFDASFNPMTNATLTFAETPYTDNGAAIACRVFNPYGESVTTPAVTLTVTRDTVAPTFDLKYFPRITLAANEVILFFSEPVTAASAQSIGNYAIATDTGPLSVLSAMLDPDRQTVTIATAAQTAGKTYTVTVNNVTDFANIPNAVAAGSKRSFFYGGVASSGQFGQSPTGEIVMETENYTRKEAYSGDDWQLRTTAAGYSGTGYMVVPNGSGGGNPNAGAHMMYDIRFTRTGLHTVWIRGWNENTSTSGNDDSIYVGFNNVRVGDGSQAALSGFPAAGWRWRSDRYEGTDPVTINVPSAGIHTFDLWHREDGTLADKIVIVPGSSTTIPAIIGADTELGPIVQTYDYLVLPPAAPTIAITSPTNNQPFAAGSDITVALAVTGQDLEWVDFYDGTNLLGRLTAPPWQMTVPDVPEGIYNLSAKTMDVLGQSAESGTVRIVVDSTKPVATETGSLGGNTIGILFSDLSGLDPASAAHPANYTVNNGGVGVASATLEPDGQVVILTLDAPVSGSYTVKIENVADQGFGPNVITPVTLLGTVSAFLMNQDVGVYNTNDPPVMTNPILPGAAFAMSDQAYYVRAGGADIWGNADGMHFLYKEVAGNFEIQARVESLTRPDTWSKAGLMAREDLDGNSRNFMLLVAPAAGQNLYNVQWRDTKGGASASLATAQRPTPVPYPNAWMRLTRVDQTFTFYWGTNGTDWTVFHTAVPPTSYPDKLYVGLATTSHNNGTNAANLVQAIYRDLKLVSGGAPEPPQLSVKRAGSSIEISWVSDSDQFVLQTTASLSPANWQPAGLTPEVSGNVYTVTVPIGAGPAFYRVAAP